MPKINKDTLKTLKNGVKVFKYENKNSYNCYFQVGSTYAKSGKKYYGLFDQVYIKKNLIY